MWHRVWIRTRKLATRTTYYLGWYAPDGKQRSRLVGTDKRLAQDLRRKKEMELNSGMLGEPVPVSFEKFKAEHRELTEGRVATATLSSQMEALAQLARCLKPKRLTDVDRKGVERFMVMRTREVRPATVNKQLRTLRAIFRKATGRGYLKDSPFDHVEKLKEPEKQIRILGLDEIPKLFLAAPSLRWRAFICLALTTGMRLGELCHLEWDDVDLEHGLVTIENKQGWQTKSRRIRRLALTVHAVRALQELQAAASGKTVFQTRDGKPMANNLQRDFGAIVKKAGIRHCSVHDLRRTFVSYLAMSGVNEAIVQRLAGHASIATTLRHYTHILPESLRQAQESLPYSRAESPMLTLCGPGPKDASETKTA